MKTEKSKDKTEPGEICPTAEPAGLQIASRSLNDRRDVRGGEGRRMGMEGKEKEVLKAACKSYEFFYNCFLSILHSFGPRVGFVSIAYN